MRSLLERESALRLSGDPVRDASELLASLERQLPNVLLLGNRLLDEVDAKARRAIRIQFPNLGVLLVSDRPRALTLDVIVRNRFRGLLNAGTSLPTFVRAIRAIGRGELWLPRALLERVFLNETHEETSDEATGADGLQLTRREAEAVELVCKGLTNRAIGRRLGIGEDTVKKHLHNVYGKLGVHCRTQLMAKCIGRLH